MVKICLQNIDDVAAITPTYRFCGGKSERDSGKYLIDILGRIKYESSYSISLSMIRCEYKKALKLEMN